MAFDQSKFRKICGLLGSDQPGERSAAALKATTMLKSAGMTWAAVGISGAAPEQPQRRRDPPPPGVEKPPINWRSLVKAALDSATPYTDWEYNFLETMEEWRGEPSWKQWIVADRLIRKMAGG